MNVLKIEILNPKAGRLLKDLADMNLIVINKQSGFSTALKQLRKKKAAISIDEITAEVELVRAARNVK